MQLKFERLPNLRSCLRHLGPFTIAALLWGCSGAESSNGSLGVTWTVNSTSDKTLCDNNVGWAVVLVTDSAGNKYTNGNAPCNSFNVSFGNVPSGTYGVSAYLFNAGSNATLGRVNAHGVEVNAGALTTDSINFDIATN